MKYIVKLCSIDEILYEETFHVDNQTFSYIGRIITNSLFPIEVKVERKYLLKHGVEILTTVVYYLCRSDYEKE